MSSYLKIAIVAVTFIVGFFLGRKTIDVEEKIEYVKGEIIHDTIVINEAEGDYNVPQEILDARDFARDEINRLEDEIEVLEEELRNHINEL